MAEERPLRLGVLALQGAFREHADALKRVAPTATIVIVRNAEQLASGLDGLVLPGGESTTMGLVAERSGILPALRDAVRKMPVFATCAGLIMLSNKALHMKEGGQPLLGGLDVTVDRNHFGAQRQSFETELDIVSPDLLGDTRCHGVFIRAPAIVRLGSDEVEVLARLGAAQLPEPRTHREAEDAEECIVAARQGNLLVTAFHPELTDDDRWHRYFVNQVVLHRSNGAAK